MQVHSGKFLNLTVLATVRTKWARFVQQHHGHACLLADRGTVAQALHNQLRNM